MINIITKRFAFMLLLFGLVSCQPSSYLKNAPNIPHFEQAGELQFNVYGGMFSDKFWSFRNVYMELQSAYSLTDNMGVMINGLQGVNRNYWELGTGFNHLIIDRFGLYGGAGYGKIKGFRKNWYHGNAHYQTVFLQPSYMFKNKGNEYFGMTLKSTFVHYSDYNYVYIGDYSIKGEEIHSNNANGLILHPVLSYQNQKNRVNLTYQFGYAVPLFFGFKNYMDRPLIHEHPVYQNFTLKLGIHFYFDLNLSNHE